MPASITVEHYLIKKVLRDHIFEDLMPVADLSFSTDIN